MKSFLEGKKAIVYTIDAILAIIIVVMVIGAVRVQLSIASYNDVSASFEPWVFSDTVYALYADGTFNEFYDENEDLFYPVALDDSVDENVIDGVRYGNIEPIPYDDIHDKFYINFTRAFVCYVY